MSKFERYFRMEQEARRLKRLLQDPPPPTDNRVVHDLIRHEQVWQGYYPKYSMLSEAQKTQIRRSLTKLSYPKPAYMEPTNEMTLLGITSVLAYEHMKRGASHTATQLRKFYPGREYTLDPALSNELGLVLRAPDGSAIVAFRGRQRATPNMLDNGAVTRADDVNLRKVLSGQAMDLSRERAMVEAAARKYGDVELHGYSLGGAKTLQLLQENVAGVTSAHIANPLIGARHVSGGIPERVQITRTVEDYASGPGVALGLSTGRLQSAQVHTVAALPGVDVHSAAHLLPSTAFASEELAPHLRQLKEAAHDEFREGGVEAAFTRHAIVGHAVGLATQTASGWAASKIVEGAHLRSATASDALTGGLASAINASVVTGGRSLLAGSLILPELAAVGPELIAAIPAAMAAGAVERGVDGALRRLTHNDEASADVASVVGGAVGGGVFVAGAEAVTAAAGLGAALMTGGELGGAFGALGGPVGVIAGAAVGAVVAGGMVAVHELAHLFFHHH